MDVTEFEKKLALIPEERPDDWDIELLKKLDAEQDTETVPLEEVEALRECSGKLSVRVPKELHFNLLQKAKENGISLNQFIVYKLAK